MFASSREVLCGINRANSTILTLEMKKLRSRDDSDLPKSVFRLLTEQGLESRSPHIIGLFVIHSVAVFSFAGLLVEER